MNIAYNGRFVADIETRKINGQSGMGFYRLLFQVEINTSAWEDYDHAVANCRKAIDKWSGV